MAGCVIAGVGGFVVCAFGGWVASDLPGGLSIFSSELRYCDLGLRLKMSNTSVFCSIGLDV